MSDSVAHRIDIWLTRRAAYRFTAGREGPPRNGGLEPPGLLTPSGSRRVSDPDSALPPTPASPTLGRYEPTRIGAATIRRDGVQTFIHPGAGVRVVAHGGALPVWARPIPAPLAGDETELVVVHGPGFCKAAAGGLWSDAPAPRLRIVVGDGVRTDQPGSAEGSATIHVGMSATPGERDTVARALAACAHGGGLLIGTDAGDLQRAAGVELGRPGRGRAIVIPAFADAGLAAPVGTVMAGLTASGYDGGRLMIQLVAEPDTAALDLAALDACAAAVLRGDADRDWVLSCAVADRTALVIVAFDRPASAPAEPDPAAVRSPDCAP